MIYGMVSILYFINMVFDIAINKVTELQVHPFLGCPLVTPITFMPTNIEENFPYEADLPAYCPISIREGKFFKEFSENLQCCLSVT